MNDKKRGRPRKIDSPIVVQVTLPRDLYAWAISRDGGMSATIRKSLKNLMVAEPNQREMEREL